MPARRKMRAGEPATTIGITAQNLFHPEDSGHSYSHTENTVISHDSSFVPRVRKPNLSPDATLAVPAASS